MINTIQNIKHTDSGNFFLLAGPCVVENEDMVFDIAKKISIIADEYRIPFAFKASFKKANRSRLDSFTGIGDQKALELLSAVRKDLKIPTVTDIHTEKDAEMAAKYVDILQIPAFLCRQTDLLLAAASTGKVINVKKGQFLAPESMEHAVNKIRAAGNKRVMLTERGTTFGYTDLVVDFRGIPTMKKNNCPVVLDVTHSLQQPNQSSGVTGGRPDLIETLARAGVATGIDGLFIETHPTPSEAKSDGANMLQLSKLDSLLSNLVKLREVINTLSENL